MCRLAALPPNYDPELALRVLTPFAGTNDDGVGSVYVNKGKFVVVRHPGNLKQGLAKGLLKHMPYPGWTVVHLRLKSHGEQAIRNTHPFVKGNWAVVHNGIWSDYALVRAAFGKGVKWEGETDSEVAAQLMAQVGPEEFAGLVQCAGVFLALNRNGELWAVKTFGGDLEALPAKGGGVLLASTLPARHAISLAPGHFKFGRRGGMLRCHTFKTFSSKPDASEERWFQRDTPTVSARHAPYVYIKPAPALPKGSMARVPSASCNGTKPAKSYIDGDGPLPW